MRRILALLCLSVLMACTDEIHEPDAMFRLADDSGSLRVALRGSDAAGKQYRLRNATFEVSGTAMVTLSSLDARTRADWLSTPLPTGGYHVYLRPGYEIVEMRADGTEHNVAATLNSANPMLVRVQARSDQHMSLSFQHAGGPIAFGSKAVGDTLTIRSDPQKNLLARVP